MLSKGLIFFVNQDLFQVLCTLLCLSVLTDCADIFVEMLFHQFPQHFRCLAETSSIQNLDPKIDNRFVRTFVNHNVDTERLLRFLI